MAFQQSPRITEHSWGRIELEDGRTFKDVKLYAGGARAWDWRETGTRHEPGIQPADVMELVDNGATTIVLSKGVLDRLIPMLIDRDRSAQMVSLLR